ncbi:MAG: hypothetical protein C5B50_07285 [Verrucomicrobia bacterium]|nr:MAG: hypothetical protein C5B50_07285 [Verrucomicrobiota bacterium]
MKPIKIESSRIGTTADAQTAIGVLSEAMTAPEVPQAALDASEQKQLEECEAIIATGWDNFVKVGRALASIRDQRLYRQSFRTFDQYCAKKWHYSKPHAHRLICAAETMQILVPIGTISYPTHEAQIRPLIGLNPEDAKTAWNNAVKAAEGKPITASIVLAAARPFRSPRSRGTGEPGSGTPTSISARTPPGTSWITVASYRIRDLNAMLKEADALVFESDRALRSSASSGEISIIHQKAHGKLAEAIEALEWLL